MFSPDVEIPKGKKGGQGVIVETLNKYHDPYALHEKALDQVKESKPDLYEKGLNAPHTDWYTDCAPHGVLNEFDRLFYVNGFGWIPLEKMEQIHNAYAFLVSGEFTPQHVFVVRGGKDGEQSDVSDETVQNAQFHKVSPNIKFATKASRPTAPCPEGVKCPSPSSPSHYTGSTIQASSPSLYTGPTIRDSEWISGMSKSTQPVEQDPVGEETMDDADSQPLE